MGLLAVSLINIMTQRLLINEKAAGHGFEGKDSDMAREASIAFMKIYEGVSGAEA